jgi:glycosyltransferase involved in cell wall biosynthesis
LRTEAFAKYLPEFGVDPVILTSTPETSTSMTGLSSFTADAENARSGEIVRIPWHEAKAVSMRDRISPRVPGLATWNRQSRRARQVQHLADAAIETIERQEVSSIYASAPPCETLLVGVELGQRMRLPVIADLRDLWSHVPSPPYRHVVDFWLERSAERRTLARCAAVLVNTHAAKEIVTDELAVPADRVHMIRNGYDAGEFDAVTDRHQPLERGRFVALHAGQLTGIRDTVPSPMKRLKSLLRLDYDPVRCDFQARSPRFLLEAVARMLDTHPEMTERFRLWLVGMGERDGNEALRQFPYPDCLRILPRVSQSTAVEWTCRADLLLLLQFVYTRRNRDCCIAIPGKLYTYLRSGRRILALVQPSETSELIQSHEAGRVVHPRDVAGIAGALRGEYERWEASDRAAEPELRDLPAFDRRELSRELADVMQKVAVVRAAAS